MRHLDRLAALLVAVGDEQAGRDETVEQGLGALRQLIAHGTPPNVLARFPKADHSRHEGVAQGGELVVRGPRVLQHLLGRGPHGALQPAERFVLAYVQATVAAKFSHRRRKV